MKEQPHQFKQSLSLLDATMMVAGGMIGSGIFIVSADMTRILGSAGWLLAAWVLSGLMTLAVALCYGELAGMMPKAGGQYVYLREAYNPLVGFLFGWTQYLVIQSGMFAAVAMAFAKFTAVFFPWFSPENVLFSIGSLRFSAANLLAIGSLLLLTLFHTRGVEGGKRLQTFLTVIKLLALGGLILLGFFVGFNPEIWAANWQNGWQAGSLNGTTIAGFALVVAMGTAMVGSLFSSDSWNNITFIAGEIKDPKRNIPLSLLFGTGIVCVLYLLTNIVFLGLLPLEGIANAPLDRVGTAAAGAIFGPTAVFIMAALIMISTFGCNNGLLLSGARLGYAMALDGLFIKQAARLNRFGVPAWALWVQMIWAVVLCLSGSYGALLDYSMTAALIFYVLTVVGVFILRKKQPDADRPYRTWGYPWLPIFYIIVATIITLVLFVYKWETTRWGLVIILLGIPFFYWQRRRGATAG